MAAHEAVTRRSRFVTFDGGVSVVTTHHRPDRYRQLEADLGGRKRIARGAGLSYAAASFGEEVLVQEMTSFDRLLAFDRDAASLKVEAGARVGRVLAWTQSQGLQLPVVPGYPDITIGGCIAADVHGKNPLRDGTFRDCVEAITVYHPSHGYRSATRDGDADLFETTCGGFGLTGLIVDATLRLAPARHPSVEMRAVTTDSLPESIEWLREAGQADFAYSWHDGTALGAQFGRGIVFTGRASEAAASSDRGYRAMTSQSRGRVPLSLWNRLSVPAANTIFRRACAVRRRWTASAFDAAFPFARRSLYHRLYGRRGLLEIQLLVPDARVEEFAAGLSTIASDTRPLMPMISMKRFRGGSRALSLSGSGVLFAIDLARDEAAARFAEAVDALAISSGAQPNVSKDSRLPAAVAARTLPHFEGFRKAIARLDPQRLHESELSRRLGL
jgi:decaprenylphospho-beta-D-ribofuranose 2-oxidase